jgi:hypothetical protein
MKNITLRLPLPTHSKLELIQRLAASSKTVAAEDILVTAVEDVYQQLLDSPALEDFWRDEAIEQAERESDEQEHAEARAFEQYEAEERAEREAVPV